MADDKYESDIKESTLIHTSAAQSGDSRQNCLMPHMACNQSTHVALLLKTVTHTILWLKLKF